jgi:methylase of polypeptide subunit release factors
MQSPTTPRDNPLATAYEQAIPAGVRLQNGQYYTPATVCDFMLAFSKPANLPTNQPVRVLEPGCGPGSFLGRLKDWLDVSPDDRSWDLHGVELDRQAAQLARDLLATGSKQHQVSIHTMDFISPAADELGLFDWIIGNPPYVRQEHLAQSTTVDKVAMRTYLLGKYEAYLQEFPGQKALFTQSSDLYLWFFLQATTLLKPGGRLAFITSNSWLNTAYGQHFQQFLTHHFNILALVESACERWFADAAINPLILVLEKLPEIKPGLEEKLSMTLSDNSSEQTGETQPVSLIRLLTPLALYLPDPNEKDYWATLSNQMQFTHDPVHHPKELQLNTLQPRQLGSEPFKTNWAIPLRASTELIRLLENPLLWQTLESLGQVRYPLKTGINAFFYLSKEKAKQWRIEPEFLFPVLRSSRQVKHYVVQAEHLPEYLFSCPYSKEKLAAKGMTGALAYVEWGETQSAPPRQKRTQAVPWPQVASIRSNRPWHYTRPLLPAHLLCPRFIDRRFFFPLCQGEVMEDQTFYGFTLAHPEHHSPLLLGALLNSTLSYLLAEYSGRTNLGEGALQYARCDMARFSVINPDLFSEAEKASLIEAFQTLCQRPILPLAQELTSPDRIYLDNLILMPVLGALHASETVGALRKKLASQLLDRVQERQNLANSVRKKSSAKT